MAKEKFDWKLAHEREDASKTRLNELAEKLNGINSREVKTDEEKAQLAREIADINTEIAREQGKLGAVQAQMAANMATFEINSREDVPSVAKQIREAIQAGSRFEVKVSSKMRENVNTSGYADPANTVNPDTVYKEQIVAPLYEASILGQAGVPQRTGLKGNHVYPVVEAFSVSLAQEAVKIGDAKINTSKLWAKPERAGVAVPITRAALLETENLLQEIFVNYAPAAAAELMNKVLVSPTLVNTATAIAGPFVTMKANHAITGDITPENLVKLQAVVANEKIALQDCAYIMNPSDILAQTITPMWDGAGKAVIENGKFGNTPCVPCTEVPAGTVLFGAFKYYPMDIFGDFNIVIDPYSKSEYGEINCVLDFMVAGTVLRKEAFAKLTASA